MLFAAIREQAFLFKQPQSCFHSLAIDSELSGELATSWQPALPASLQQVRANMLRDLRGDGEESWFHVWPACPYTGQVFERHSASLLQANAAFSTQIGDP
jgi:hypothetical protein